ncbi:uncharacterized protein [Haliotis cracherodii]|uniref:uncharacterized protein n=1 Tax=Haliotis cracherodii TaxID=6455 RepID=UPI0039E99D2B
MPKKAPRVQEPETVARPNLQWEVGAHSLEDILQKYPLPRVVQCAYTLSDDVSTEQSNFDFLQPMLLYQKRVCNKVTATSLNTDPQTGNTVEVGAPLLIPEDYKGWFAVKFTSCDKPIPHYRKVANLASSDCDTFLIGGDHEVNAVQIYRQQSSPQQRVLYPGDVLRMGNLYVATSKVKKSIFSKSVTLEERFLLCTDLTDREVMLPINATGVFYILKHKTTQKPTIMQVKDIIAKAQLPCKVKLVFGRIPPTPCIFTGVLNLNEFHLETSAIVSSVFNLRNILLEIPTTIPLMFRVAKSDTSLLNSSGYTRAMGLCQNNAEMYMRNIKAAQGLPTEVNRNHTTPPARRDKQTNETTADSKPNAAVNMDSKINEKKSASPIEVKSLPRVLPKPLNLTGSMPDTEADDNVTPDVPPRTPLKPTKLPSFSPPQHRVVKLGASVGFGTAPKLVVRSSQKVRPLAQPPASNKPKQESYESVWIEPKSSTSPPTPPKCVPSSYVHPKPPQKVQTKKTIRISTTYGYLTVPMYLNDDDSDPEEVINLADKINFWQRISTSDLDGSSVDPLNPSDDDIGAGRRGCFTYSETGGPTKRDYATMLPAKRQENVMVYENIQSLRQLTSGNSGSVTEALACPSSHSEPFADDVNVTDYEMPDRPKTSLDEDDGSSKKWKKNQTGGPPAPPPKPTKKEAIASYTRGKHHLPTKEDVIYESPDEKKLVTASHISKKKFHQIHDIYEPVDKFGQKEITFQPSHLSSSADDVVYESPDDRYHLEQIPSPSPPHVMEDVIYEPSDNRRQGMCDSPCADSGIGIMDEGADGSSTIVAMSAAEVNDKLRQAGGIKQKTLALLLNNNIDGRQLFDMGENGLQLKFPSISNIEKRMINLFIHGCQSGVFKL